MRLAFLYSLLAVLATMANIGSQMLFVSLYSAAHAVLLSVIVGTGVGLWLKYILDKRYIFRYRTRGIRHEGQVFVLYSLMGVITTLLFWLVEFSFHAYFKSAEMRYAGGVLGLALGYWIKYRLDKRYVFSPVSTVSMVR